MSVKFKVHKVNRGVMLRIAGITFYLSTEEARSLGSLLGQAIDEDRALALAPPDGLPRPPEGPENTRLGGLEMALEGPSSSGGPELGPKAPEALEGPENKAPEASPEALEGKRGRPRAKKPTTVEEEEREGAMMAGAPVTNRDRP